ncbi:MAG: tRNA (adenosine(37)-N6)-threonylcarbamoyltransferase complex ATPase subunit type 1 TsaE [Candidatus Yanofskybacteria bacterium]|nr:tRNA (adenosine(37)-N6)-threonylcarbamoyltransferase complex ATPase subunit type 1 TsaE [Candidatus Yanofskybacteria bacterium]
MHLVSQSPEDTAAIAARLAERVRASLPRTEAIVIALIGDLGAGKTTFTQGFASALGIRQQPKSPTFLLAKEYSVPGTPYSLWHLDCYRLTGRQDLITLDLHHIFEQPNNIVLVEWPEKIGEGLPRDTIEVRFTHEGPTSRGITINENP